MDGWDIALLAAAAYIAVTALVRLMLRRRQQLWEQYRQQAEAEQERQVEVEQAARRRTA